MSLIKPQIHIDTGLTGTKYEFFKTYHKDLVPNIGKVMEKYGVYNVLVIRSRRGEWGEWWERWEMDYRRKPFKVKEGWS